MVEYLEKTAVIKAIHNEIYSGGKWSGGWYEKSEEQAEKDFTKRINAITPVTKEHGEWEEYGHNVGDDYITIGIRCSKCHKEPPKIDPHKEKSFMNYIMSDFCPNCGADMRGEKNDKKRR